MFQCQRICKYSTDTDITSTDTGIKYYSSQNVTMSYETQLRSLF